MKCIIEARMALRLGEGGRFFGTFGVSRQKHTLYGREYPQNEDTPLWLRYIQSLDAQLSPWTESHAQNLAATEGFMRHA
jgi:hypothetical protein